MTVRKEVSESGRRPEPANDRQVPLNFQLISTTSSEMRWWNAQTGEIQNVKPGTYQAQFMTASPWCVKSAQAGNVDLLSEDLSVTLGAHPPAIEVTLRDGAASISGSVVQTAPGPPATVLLVQPRSQRNLIKAVPTQDKYEFQGVCPGDYLLLALTGDSVEYENPDVLSPYLSNAVRISLRPSAAENVNLTAFPVGR